MHLGTVVPTTDSQSAKPASTPLCTRNGMDVAAIPTHDGRWLICESDADAEVWRLSTTSWNTLQGAAADYSFHADCDVNVIEFGAWTYATIEIAEAA